MSTSKRSVPSVLVDRFGRVVDYVRISITDRCDFRCVYCMAEQMEFLPRPQILTLEEILEVCAVFTGLGVRKIRVTGGEPLVRNGVVPLLNQIGALPGLSDFVITTNGARLGEFAGDLKQAGISRINISLDSLRPDRFGWLTRVGRLETVLAGLDAARGQGFRQIKLNTVVLRNRNHDEIVDLVHFAIDKETDISFIEEMPLGIVQGHDRHEDFYSSDEVREDIARHFDILPSTETTGGPSRYYRIAGTRTKVGFISPHSHNFCSTCNRVRVTAEGRLLLCLGNEHSVDLRAILRSGDYSREKLGLAIVDAMQIKPERHHFDITEQPVILRHMSVTGG